MRGGESHGLFSLEEETIVRQRDNLEVIVEVLSLTNPAMCLTRIIQKANLNHKRAKTILNSLVEAGCITLNSCEIGHGKSHPEYVYSLTPKGRTVIESYGNLKMMLRGYDTVHLPVPRIHIREVSTK